MFLRSKVAAFAAFAGLSATVATAATASDIDVQSIAEEAYIYGYPLVLMDISKQVMTNVANVSATKAPINQFVHLRTFPDASFTDVVSPNADTLYSSAMLDLSREPIILSVPDTNGRYYLFQMLSAWTNVFASPGKRTTGTRAGNFAIVGPTWTGTLPPGVTEYRSPTNLVWILGRTQTNGPSDYAAVHALQNKYKLTPLSAWGTNYRPPTNVATDPNLDMTTPPVDQAANLSAPDFFERLAKLMKANPPAKADDPILARMAEIGIVPGRTFNTGRLDQPFLTALAKARNAAKAKIAARASNDPSSPTINGWQIAYDLGTYGTDYLLRAFVALYGLGANLPEDAIYPRTAVDSTGAALDGANRYVIHFEKDQVPPVNAFWSLTMYNDRQFFVANPINRYAIGDRDALKFNADGSLDIYIQNAAPGATKESNWLPAPSGKFNMLMRLYWPKPEVLDRTWQPPGVDRAD